MVSQNENRLDDNESPVNRLLTVLSRKRYGPDFPKTLKRLLDKVLHRRESFAVPAYSSLDVREKSLQRSSRSFILAKQPESEILILLSIFHLTFALIL